MFCFSWILQALAESGDTHLLYEEPNTQPHRDYDANTGVASSSTEPPPKRIKTSQRRGSDSLSLSQAVEAYCASDLDSEEEPVAQADDDDLGPPQDPSLDDPDSTPLSLLFSGLYQGNVTLGKYGYYYATGTNSGQHYIDLGYDPAEDSSWCDEMFKPLEGTEVPAYYPTQGSNWGSIR